MGQKLRDNGIVVRTPDENWLDVREFNDEFRAEFPGDPELEDIGDVFGEELRLVDRFVMVATPQGSEIPPNRLSFAIDVPTGLDEGAVLLMEQAGLYMWAYPDASWWERFEQRMDSFVQTLHTMSTSLLQDLGDRIREPVRVWVFKYTGRLFLKLGIPYFERNVQPGLVHVTGKDPLEWKSINDLANFPLEPKEQGIKILLLVHGTFSSTKGGFGSLYATRHGVNFLQRAWNNYSAVIGFDHRTLSVDPGRNAEDLLKLLSCLNEEAEIDAISHSRGGITLRSLIEHNVWPNNIRPGKALFVGATNGGTDLANPKNVKSFINFYTNLVVAACRIVRHALPHASVAAEIFSGAIKGVAGVVKAVASEAITKKVVPGLAAMYPAGPVVTNLNAQKPPPGYFAITSDFNALAALKIEDHGIGKRLIGALKGGLARQLLGTENDLVVNTPYMTVVGPNGNGKMPIAHHFLGSGIVHHTNYFLQPQTIDALMTELGI